jgi:hypothetical protein
MTAIVLLFSQNFGIEPVHAATAGGIVADITYSTGLGITANSKTFTLSTQNTMVYVSDTPVGGGFANCWFSGSGIDSLAIGVGSMNGSCGTGYAPGYPDYREIISCTSLAYERVGVEMIAFGGWCQVSGIYETLVANIVLAPVTSGLYTQWKAIVTFTID